MSATLKPKHKGGRQWLADIGESAALVSAILAVVHPDLFDTGMEAINRLGHGGYNIGEDPDRADVLSVWPSAFNGMSAIINRDTPSHRDTNSRAEWYDILVTIGRYQNLFLDFPGLNLKLKYEGGTVVAFSGRLLLHRVEGCKEERICLAMYMRDNLHHRLGLPAPTWMHQQHYINMS